MPRAPCLRLRLDQTFKDALKAVIFTYVEMGEVRMDEVGMILADLESYTRKLDHLTKHLAKGTRFKLYSPQGVVVGELQDPDQIIRLHLRGFKVVMLGLPEQDGLEVRWSG